MGIFFQELNTQYLLENAMLREVYHGSYLANQ